MTRRHVVAALAALIAMATLAVISIPLSTTDLERSPEERIDYDTAVSRITASRERDRGTVAEHGESILLTHGRRVATAVLLLHGLTNSPLQFDSLAHLLYQDGDNVYVPRLPHHAEAGGDARSLAALKADDLVAAGDSAVDLAGGLGDSVVVAGLSVGGTIAAWIAQHRSVHRAVLIAPLLGLDRVPHAVAWLVDRLSVRLPNFTRRQAGNRGEPDRELGWTTHAVGEILRLGIEIHRAAVSRPAGTRDIAVVLNDNDRTIATAPVLSVANEWKAKGAAVRIYRIPDSLGLPHDIVDPRQPVRRTDLIYPMLRGLIHGIPRESMRLTVTDAVARNDR